MRYRDAGPAVQDFSEPGFQYRSVGARGLGQNGQVHLYRPVVLLPGQVPVKPAEGGSDHGTLVPASRYDLLADGLGSAAQGLAHDGGLTVACLALEKMHAADADTDFWIAAQADQRVLGPRLAAAPATALAGPFCRYLGLSAHRGSHLSATSVGTRL